MSWGACAPRRTSPLRLDCVNRGRRSWSVPEWNAPQLVLHMLRLTAFALLLTPAVFVASPLTADDLYGAPDPGWYNAGSGWPSEGARGQGYDGGDYGQQYGTDEYGYAGRDFVGAGTGAAAGRAPGFGYTDGDWGADPSPAPGYPYDGDTLGADRYGYDGYQDRGDTWQRPEAPKPVVPDGYGAPDWASQPLPRSPDGYDRQRQRDGRDDYAGGQGVYRDGRDDYAGSQGVYRDDRGPWRAPQSRSRQQYRFREDPALEQHAVGGTAGGYVFRPLTRKEQERHRDVAQYPRFVEPHRDQRQRPGDDEEQGAAFGYAPGPVPQDDFYQRYYRSGR